MNKLKHLLILLTIILTTQGKTPIFLDVYAGNVPSTNLPTACGDNRYSVDKIVGYDNFQNIACYSETEFTQAYQKMLENAPNSVIRHNSSESPLNIVAADRAIAYSMNDTYLKEDTLIVYGDQNITTNYTYINQSNTLYYYDTYVIGTATTVKPENLSVLIEVNGAKGYVKLKGIDIIPMIYVENRIDQTLAEPSKDTSNSWYVAYQTRTSTGAYTSISIRPNISFYIVAPIDSSVRPSTPTCGVSNGDLVLYTDTATSSFCRPVGKAPAWLPAGKYYSTNGIDFYYDMDLSNPVLNNGVPGKHYNYFSYLPLRSKSNYSAQELNNYLKTVLTTTTEQEKSAIFGKEQLFIDAQNTHGMNALLILAMGALESNFGRSGYAQLPANLNGLIVYNADTGVLVENTTVTQFCTQFPSGKYKDEFGTIRYCLGRNNIFGYAAFDSDPNNAAAFSSLEAGIKEHMGKNLRYYLDAMNTNQFSSSIGNKGVGVNTRYASDPWWSVKIASIAYQADRNLGSKDYDYHQIGLLKNDVSRDFYSDYSLGTKLYSINSKASTYTVVVLEQNVDKYKVQSTNPITNLNTVVVSPSGSWMKPVNWTPTLTYKYSSETEPYDWANSFDYKFSSDITLINSARTPINKITGTDSLIIYTSKLEWIDNSIYIYGYSALRNTDMNVLSTSHVLKFIDLASNEVKYSFPLNFATPEFPLNFLNGYDYSKAWFEGTVDMTGINPAYYRILLETSTSNVKSSDDLSNTDRTAPRPLPKNIGASNYKFIFNNTERMRYELYIENGLSYPLQETPLISRFYPVAFFNSFDVTDGLFTFEGIAYQIGNTTNQASSVEQKLVLLSSDGIQHVFELNESAGKYNYSNGGNDYSFAWFDNSIDLKSLPTGDYKLFIINSSNGQIDTIEIRDYLGFKLYTSTLDGRKYTLTSDPKLKDKISLRIE